MKKIIIILILICFNIKFFKGQSIISDDGIHYTCQVDGKAVADMNSALKIPQSTFPSSLVVTCAGGSFRLYYEDDYIAVTTGSAAGFADPLLGATRKNTYCAVLQYIKNTFNLNGQVLDIYVAKSFSNINPAPVTYSALGMAGSFFVPGTYGSAPGFFGGNFYQHVLTGIDPDPNEYDGMLTMTFDQLFNSPISYWDDYLNTTTPCKIDLYSVLLHETTHIMGWLSALGEGPSPNNYLVVTSNTSNIQSFTKFDQLFLWAGDVRTPGTFTGKKLVQGTTLNPTFVSIPSVLRNNQIWMNSNGAPNNHHTYDGSQPFVLNTTSSANLAPKSFLSHLDYSNFSFYDACQHSPGYQPRYVMGQSMQANSMKREYTNAEFRYLNQLGYNYTSAFASSTSLSGGVTSNSNLLSTNAAPYRSNIATTNIVAWPATTQAQIDAAHLFPETKPADFTITNNNAPGGPITTVFTINTHTLPNITDANGQTIGVYPNSLYGIRGVTTAGNNHNSIVLTGSNTITYTPPPGYIGRAEFAFQLWDGIEAGARKMITIDVLPGAYTIPVGNELMINGGFEDATERKTVSNQSSPTSNVPGGDNLLINELNFGFVFHGGSPFGHMVNAQSNWSGGVLRRESYQGCWITPTFGSGTNTFGIYTTSFGSYMMGSSSYSMVPESCPTPPTNNECQIFVTNSIRNVFTKTLMNPLKTCKNYQFDFDISYSAGNNVSVGSVVTLTLNAISNITANFTWPSVINFTNHQAIPLTFTVIAISTNAGNTNWQHVTANFFYCGTPTRYLLLNGPAAWVMDNLSLKELTTPPPPLIVTAVNSSTLFCPGNTATLTGNAVNTTCSMTYTWKPMNVVSPTIVVTPPNINTTYTLFGNDGCRTGSAVITPVPIPSGSFTAPAICVGNFSSYSLQSLLPVGTSTNGTFSGTAIFNGNCSGNPCSYIDLTGNLGTYPAGVYNYTYSITNGSNCVQNYTFNVTFNPQPTNSIAINPQSCLVAAQQVTLTAQPSPTTGVTYTWQPGGANTASIVVSPTVTTTYTLNSSNGVCANTKTLPVVINPTITFTNLPSTWCTQQNIFYLENYLAAGTPTGGTWTIPNLGVITTPSPGLTQVNINPNLTTLGTHTVYYSYTAPSTTCTVNNQFTVNVIAGFSLTTNGQVTYCTNLGLPATISATATPSSGVTFTWQPGTLSGSSTTVSPGTNTTYTVTASIGGQCTATNAVSVLVSTTCCQATNYMSGAPTSGTYTGSWAINQNITINSPVTFDNAEFKIAKDVTITIANGGTLNLQYCHLYSCGDMWNGIIVNNGGQVISPGQVWNPNLGQVYDDNRVLIEDAKTAISMNNCTNTSNVIGDYNIVMQNAVFNKNYVGISFKNYNYSARAPIEVNNCVFSCRTLTFNATTWPAPTTTLNGLRYSPASTPTTGFASPYDLQSAAVVNLKAPNSGITSMTGISLDNVGILSGSVFYGAEIGNESSETYFNVFDSHAYSIDATNSNLRSINNVFQNTKELTITTCNPRCISTTIGGSAIRQIINTHMIANLNLNAAGTSSASSSFGNRFWNCQIGVDARNTYRFNMERAIFRSTQTTSSHTGNAGVYAVTNRFQYNMRFNEFSNICNAVNIPIYAGTYDMGAGVQTGIYAGNLVVNYNYFGANQALIGSLGGKFMSQAVSITSPNSTTWQFAANTGLFVQNNDMYRVYRGIQLSGLAGYSCTVTKNYITMIDDNLFSALQRGIEVTSTQNKAVVSTNTLSSNNITNTLTTLCYFGANTGTNSPKVTCNDLSNSYKAFEFNATNLGTYWRGNLMNTHARGLTLSTSATISPQGSSGNPQDNAWNGTWTAGTNYGTYMDNSDATKSGIWYKTALALPTNTGNTAPSQYYGAPNTITLTTGSYDCSSGSARMASSNKYIEENNNLSNSNSRSNNALFSESQYVNQTSLYRYIEANPSVKDSNITYSSFYNSKLNSSMDQFVDIEKALYGQQASQAQNLNNMVTSGNSVENNYKSFYTLHTKYQLGTFTDADSSALVQLANLCPGLDGEVIYQARALYNTIYKTVITYHENCDPLTIENSRFVNENKITTEDTWSIELYPNPNSGSFKIVSSAKTEELKVVITDVVGKIIYSNQINTSNFIANLDIKTSNGVYLIIIKNSKNEQVTKKLVIAN